MCAMYMHFDRGDGVTFSEIAVMLIVSGGMDENDTDDTRTTYRSKNCTEFSVRVFARLGGG